MARTFGSTLWGMWEHGTANPHKSELIFACDEIPVGPMKT